MISNKQLFLLNNAQTSSSPRLLEIDRAEGVFLFDTQGKSYFDLVSGFAVSNIGHRHPAVINAVQQQLGRYMHLTVYGEYVQAPQVRFATKLLSVLPDELESVYFVNSGAEATEGALKLAKRYTGRQGIISCRGAYHGSTNGALSVMGNEYYREGYQPLLPGVEFIDFNDMDQLDQIGTATACVIIEPVQGEAGIRVPSASWMRALRDRCTATGALLIVDEIQTAFGRTGRMFAFEHSGIAPDILLLAKALGGGMPVGAFVAPRVIMDVLKDNPVLGHITTFGGHPVCCAAGLAALEVLLQDRLVDAVADKGALFRHLLVHPAIREIRGLGLMLAIQLDNFSQVERFCRLGQENGLIMDWFLHCDSAVRISPPLIITEEQIKTVCDAILRVLDLL